MAEEKNYENRVKRFLEKNKIYGLGSVKVPAGTRTNGYYQKRWGGGRFQKTGLPDLLVVINGRAFEFELKSATGHPSADQIKILSQINNAGGHGEVMYPVDEKGFYNFILTILKEEGLL